MRHVDGGVADLYYCRKNLGKVTGSCVTPIVSVIEARAKCPQSQGQGHLDLRHAPIYEQLNAVMKLLLSSEARNVAAFAISSGLPILPIGTADKRPSLNCSFCSSVSNRPHQNLVCLSGRD